jgi:TfoX/Sxy family transcriptional regulator of competence genes
MATQQSTVDLILEQIAAAGAVSAKKMFGEYGIYCDGRMVALVCDNELFIKKTEAGKALVGDIEEKSPYPGAKPCFLISGERWEEREWLSKLISVSAAELPVPKKKTKAASTKR